MTLTVPRSNAGFAATPSIRVEAPTTGNALGQFGNQLQQVGQAIEGEALDRQFRRAGAEMMRDMNQARFDVSQIGDPEQAAAAWEARKTTIRETYRAGQDDNGRPRLHPMNQQRFETAFMEFSSRLDLGVASQTLDSIRAQREADLMVASREAARLAVTQPDAETRAVALGQVFESIDAMVATNQIDAAEAQRRKLALMGEVDNARAMEMVAKDPEAFLGADPAEFDGLDPDVMQRYRLTAEGNIASAREKAIKDGEAAAKLRAKEIADELATIRDIRAKGMQPANEAFLASPEVKAHPDYAMTIAARGLALEKPNLQQATPAQIQAMIAEEEATPVTRQYQTERVEFLRGLLKTTRDSLRDPVAHARGVGLDVPDLPEFDPADPQAYAVAVRARAELGTQLVEQGYTTKLRLFDDAELDQMRALAGPDSDPATRAALAATLHRAMPADAREARMNAISNDPVFGLVGGYLTNGGSTATAQAIFRGQQRIAAGNVVAPSKTEKLTRAGNVFGDLFKDVRGGENTQRAVLEAADALYATRRQGQDAADDFDDDTYAQALHEVMGGRGTFDTADAEGGVTKLRGKLTILPMGVSRRDVETAITGLRRDLTGAFVPANESAVRDAINGPELGDPSTGGLQRPLTLLTAEQARARADQRLQAAAIGGGLPGVNGDPLDARDWAKVTLRALDPETFVLVRTDGQVIPRLDDPSRPWEFNLARLVEEFDR